MGLSLPHLLVIVLLVFMLFGANRFPNMMGDLAKGIKSFKHGLKDEDEVSTTEPARDMKSLPRTDDRVISRDERVEQTDIIDHIDRT